MDNVIEKLGIYELFTVLGAGIIANVMWLYASGKLYIIDIPYKEENIKILIFLVVCYFCGLVLQECSSLLEKEFFKFRENSRKSFLLDNNDIVKNKKELAIFRTVAKTVLNKNNLTFSEKDCEAVHFIAKTYLEKHTDNSKISRINSIYGMSRSLALSSFLSILLTIFSYVLFDAKFFVGGKLIPVIMVEILFTCLFFNRTKRFAKYKVRVVMRYYVDSMNNPE